MKNNENKKTGKFDLKYKSEKIDWDRVHRRLENIKSRIDSGWNLSGEDMKLLLKKRSEELAKQHVKKEKNVNDMFIVEFFLGDEKYGIEASYLQEVYPLRELTVLPGSPGFILGIINVRGKILPVMNIKKFFGIPEKGITNLNRVLIVKKNLIETGILADEVTGVTGINSEELQPAMVTLTGIKGDYLQGITKERLIILDIVRILDDPEIIVYKKFQKRGLL